MREQLQISGRPVFGADRVIGGTQQTASAAKIIADAIDADYVSRQVTRMQAALAGEPDVAIGTAKEFVETIFGKCYSLGPAIVMEYRGFWENGEANPKKRR